MMCPMYIADRSHRCIEEMAILLRSSPSRCQIFSKRFSWQEFVNHHMGSTEVWSRGNPPWGSDTNIFPFSCYVKKRRVTSIWDSSALPLLKVIFEGNMRTDQTFWFAKTHTHIFDIWKHQTFSFVQIQNMGHTQHFHVSSTFKKMTFILKHGYHLRTCSSSLFEVIFIS